MAPGRLSPEERLLEAIRKDQRRIHSITGGLPIELHQVVNLAAESRDLSRSAYVALTVTSFAAFDLGLDRDTVLDEFPIWATPFGSGLGPADRTDRGAKNGRGHGAWVIESLR